MSSTKDTKYIFVLGGVMSGLGKGIAAASIGYLLKNSGTKVTILKFVILLHCVFLMHHSKRFFY